MQIDTYDSAVSVTVGATFVASDVARLQEGVASLGRIAKLTVDFSGTLACEDSTLLLLAGALQSLKDIEIVLFGLSRHQLRLLEYLGFALDAIDLSSGARGGELVRGAELAPSSLGPGPV